MKNKEIEYLIYTEDAQGEKQIRTDWRSSSEASFSFLIPKGSGTIFIETRPKGETETTNFVQIAE
ncbi:MAG: hypothetical protein K2K54_11150 [Lachnospiraceae bacterium]|nr:hypothetical protein [Lachnospiraceae bacterium]